MRHGGSGFTLTKFLVTEAEEGGTVGKREENRKPLGWAVERERRERNRA